MQEEVLGQIPVAGLNVELALHYSVNGIEGVWDNIENYLMDAEEHERQLQTCFENQRFEEYTVLVHAVKSALALIGCDGIANWAKSIEQAGRQKDYDFILKQHKTFLKRLQSLNRQLQGIPHQNTEKNKQLCYEERCSLTKEEFCKRLMQLQIAAQNMDTVAVMQGVDRLKDCCCQDRDIEADYKKLLYYSDRFEYGEIVILIKKITDEIT